MSSPPPAICRHKCGTCANSAKASRRLPSFEYGKAKIEQPEMQSVIHPNEMSIYDRAPCATRFRPIRIITIRPWLMRVPRKRANAKRAPRASARVGAPRVKSCQVPPVRSRQTRCGHGSNETFAGQSRALEATHVRFSLLPDWSQHRFSSQGRQGADATTRHFKIDRAMSSRGLLDQLPLGNSEYWSRDEARFLSSLL